MGFGGDFIHDQTSGINRVITAFISYYDSGGQVSSPRPTDIANYAPWPPSNDSFKDPNSRYFNSNLQEVIARMDRNLKLIQKWKRLLMFYVDLK